MLVCEVVNERLQTRENFRSVYRLTIEHFAVVFQSRNLKAGNFRAIVPSPQPDSALCTRLSFELASLAFGKRTTLQIEAQNRSRRELRLITGVFMAQIALRVNVQAYRLGYCWTKILPQPYASGNFVGFINALLRHSFFAGQQMPDVV